MAAQTRVWGCRGAACWWALMGSGGCGGGRRLFQGICLSRLLVSGRACGTLMSVCAESDCVRAAGCPGVGEYVLAVRLLLALQV